MKKLLITAFVVILIAGAAVGAYYYKYGKAPEPEIASLQVTRGDVIMQVGATGTLEAVTTVDVGTQVNGVIKDLFGTDFNKIVKKGQLIAKIDPATIEAKIESDRAQLESANANLERQRVGLEDSQNKLRRAEDLSKRNLITQQDLETAQVNVKTNLASIRAQEASIKQTQAVLNQDLVNLGYTNIYAPITGIVINRKVDVGQTVVSNNLATSLFQIAADLTQMQVKAGVDESDVGNLRPGQLVTFRVDAFLNKEFVGTVAQVRLQPVVTQNVVTYTTIINVRNPYLELKPGMTATVKIEIAKKENVLRIPNAALRFRPTREIFEALNLEVPPELQQRGRGQGGTRGGQNAAIGQPAQGATGQGGAFQRGGGDRPAQPANQQATLPRGGQGQPGASSQPRGTGQGAQQGQRSDSQLGGGRGGQGGGQQMTPEERQKRLQERMATMTPEERARFEERMKQFGQSGGRGQGAQGGQGVGNRGGMGGGRNPPAANEIGPTEGVANRDATTIDALFGPLQFTELPGRVWIYTVNGTTKSLKSYSVRTGISDGTVTELVEGAGIDENSKLVTSIDLGQNNQQVRPGSSPLMPGGRPGGGPGGGGGGRGGR